MLEGDWLDTHQPSTYLKIKNVTAVIRSIWKPLNYKQGEGKRYQLIIYE